MSLRPPSGKTQICSNHSLVVSALVMTEGGCQVCMMPLDILRDLRKIFRFVDNEQLIYFFCSCVCGAKTSNFGTSVNSNQVVSVP